MYVVGVTLLRNFWERHPQSQAELRALHALLSETRLDALATTLGRTAAIDGGGLTIELRTARVRVEISSAAAVARYAEVETIGEVSP